MHALALFSGVQKNMAEKGWKWKTTAEKKRPLLDWFISCNAFAVTPVYDYKTSSYTFQLLWENQKHFRHQTPFFFAE